VICQVGKVFGILPGSEFRVEADIKRSWASKEPPFLGLVGVVTERWFRREESTVYSFIIARKVFWTMKPTAHAATGNEVEKKDICKPANQGHSSKNQLQGNIAGWELCSSGLCAKLRMPVNPNP
jgi:hypothetical protein